jgi:cell division septum initiation protein DivIVA
MKRREADLLGHRLAESQDEAARLKEENDQLRKNIAYKDEALLLVGDVLTLWKPWKHITRRIRENAMRICEKARTL